MSTLNTARPKLTAEQAQVIEAISQAGTSASAHLVWGVTGSGKTEIYLHLLERIVAEGGQGLVLVPEIALTPQLTDRFSQRLGAAVSVIHSQLTPREKTNQWYDMLDGKKQILIGARSALFCPLPHLRLIVLDEEHEASFKQEEKLKYHARDAALMLGQELGVPVVMGSATPSLETWRNCQLGKFRLHRLKERVENRPLPEIRVVDLREPEASAKTKETPKWMSGSLFSELKATLDRREQAALFLNRRGVAGSVVCRSCGHLWTCPNCSVSLTLHGRTSLVCHYCNYTETLSESCPKCEAGEPKPLGLGTEQIETDLQRLFPNKRVTRMDRDEVATREDLHRAIAEIESGESDLLVGTQMIAKGLDFPRLTMVGLVLADISFHQPDFRANERTFQLITQVAGRAGRHLTDRRGTVLVQTYTPDHPALGYAIQNDFEGFAEAEFSFRKDLGYPPFARLAQIRIQGGAEDRVIRAAKSLRTRTEGLREHLLQKGTIGPESIDILGPAPAPLMKLRNTYRWQILVKGPTPQILSTFCRRLTHNLDWLPPGVKVLVDIDAVNLM
jgi:primosomal protein N' (replication factor Y)